MLSKILFKILSISFCFGLQDFTIYFPIDYFVQRNVKFCCVLTGPEDVFWTHEFAKVASNHSITVSKVMIDNTPSDLAIGQCLTQTHSSIGIFMDSRVAGFQDVLYFASENILFDSRHIWLIIDHENYNAIYEKKAKNSKSVLNPSFEGNVGTELFNNLNLSVDADIHIGQRTKPDEYDLYEVFNFGKIQGGNVIVKKASSWNHKTGLDKKIDVFKMYNRWDFKELAIRMIVVLTPPPPVFDPEMIIGEHSTPRVAAITKTTTMVLHTVAEIHNIKYKYTLTDKWVGDFNRNSSRVVTNSLYFREQDITPLLRLIKEVSEKLDYVYPAIGSLETKYYYRIPTSGFGQFENQFLRPLTTGAWICVTFMTLLCALMLLLSAKLEQRPSSGQYAFFSVIASFSQQSFDDRGDQGTQRESSARKITHLVTSISCLLIYNYYTSSVVSWLLNGPPPSINSLQELLDSPLELIYEDIGYTRSWLQFPDYYFNKRNAKVEDEMRQKKVFKKKKGAPLLVDVEQGIQMVKDGGYAYHTESNSANMFISRKFTQSELCEIGSLQSMDKSPLMAIVPKKSPYKEFYVWRYPRRLIGKTH